MDDMDFYEPEEIEDEIVERYRNWPIYKDVGGELYVTITGEELWCKDVNDARKEIDKGIKQWGWDKRHGRI